MFTTEKEMSENFLNFLKDNMNYKTKILQEPKGLWGIPDFLLIKYDKYGIKFVVSMELKLKNYQQGIKQAFKYRGYSNISFVIIDETNIHNALKSINDFKKFNIGLLSFNNKRELIPYFVPKLSKPFSLEYFKQKLNKLCREKSINEL